MGKKWNPDSKPAEKLLALYTMLLFSGREASLTELATELNCSKQAVIRLVDQLEASRFGKLLRSKRGREAVYRLDRPKRLPKISLNAEGLYQLALCRDFILHLLPDRMRNSVDATLQQASAFLPEDSGLEFLEKAGESFVKGCINYTPFQGILETLMRGIREHKVCIVRYKADLNRESKEYEYAPKRLVAFQGAIHIAGWVVTDKGTAQAVHDAPTSLALHRLQGVELTRRATRHLPEPQKENQGAFGLMADELFTARVRFDKSAATYVAEREWSADQKIFQHQDGGITLTMTSRSPAELAAWVLSFGDTAEALSPGWLRERLARQARNLAARYGTAKE